MGDKAKKVKKEVDRASFLKGMSSYRKRRSDLGKMFRAARRAGHTAYRNPRYRHTAEASFARMAEIRQQAEAEGIEVQGISDSRRYGAMVMHNLRQQADDAERFTKALKETVNPESQLFTPTVDPVNPESQLSTPTVDPVSPKPLSVNEEDESYVTPVDNFYGYVEDETEYSPAYYTNRALLTR